MHKTGWDSKQCDTVNEQHLSSAPSYAHACYHPRRIFFFIAVVALLVSSLFVGIHVVGEGETITLHPVDTYYQRGDTVTITGYISPPESGEYVGIEVKDSANSRLIFLTPQTNATGNFSTDFVIPAWAALGTCTIYASYAEARDNTTFTLVGDMQVSGPYPPNQSTEIARPPTNISILVTGADLDVYFYFYNMTPVTDTWTLFASWTGVSTGRCEVTDFTAFDNDFLWGNTTYRWSVNVTDGSSWMNRSYSYTTVELANGANSRYDVSNDNWVDGSDLLAAYSHRTGIVSHDGIYDVNDDNWIDGSDLLAIYAHRS